MSIEWVECDVMGEQYCDGCVYNCFSGCGKPDGVTCVFDYEDDADVSGIFVRDCDIVSVEKQRLASMLISELASSRDELRETLPGTKLHIVNHAALCVAMTRVLDRIDEMLRD